MAQAPSDLPQLHDRMRDSNTDDNARVYLTREARDSLAKLDPSQRAALRAVFSRVGYQLLSSGQHVTVEPGWARGTRARRRYPQQCYAKTARYVLDHAEIKGMQPIHGVVSHPPLYVPLDHAWVELPGDIVFDGVLQTFFTRASYYAIMAAMAVDAYSAADTRRLMASQGHPGPWNANWVPTSAQLDAYAAGARGFRGAPATDPPSMFRHGVQDFVVPDSGYCAEDGGRSVLEVLDLFE